ncbi:hypothetical protein [Mycolicibacterium sp.]|uniref:hypothetical protein n=1 Tax=Mycolicibacterium sp. TaxID=2320850 RepID=UPI0037C5C18A
MADTQPKRDPFTALLDGVREYANTTDEKQGREVLLAAVKQFLAELTDEQFAELVAEVREPADDADEAAYPAGWLPKSRND